MVTSETLRPGRSDGGEAAAWFASLDGSLDFTKFSELLANESNDNGAYDELMESIDFGGGGVGDFRIIGETGRAKGDAGCSTVFIGDGGHTTNGSDFAGPDVVGI